MARTMPARYFSGKPRGSLTWSAILEKRFFCGSREQTMRMASPWVSRRRLSQKFQAKMPAQVAMEARNRSKGSGAEASPPYFTD